MSATVVGPGRRRLRALFVSDLHLGYKGADVAALNALLDTCEVEQLYLVGDILDGWKLEKRWHWTQGYCDLIDRLMRLRRQRVRITLITGNHDEKLREILPRLLRPLILRRFGIRIEERCWHRTAAGARLLVTHGDQFDGMLRRGSSRMADRLWGWLLQLGQSWPLSHLPAHQGRRWSLGRAILREGGGLAERYSAAALRRTIREDADGIVFGHSHVPMLEDRGGRWLANCGAWTRAVDGHHSAIAETPDGRLELLRWPASPPPGPAAPALHAAPLRVRNAESARLVRHIHALWCPTEPRPLLLQQPAEAGGQSPAAVPAAAATTILPTPAGARAVRDPLAVGASGRHTGVMRPA